MSRHTPSFRRLASRRNLAGLVAAAALTLPLLPPAPASAAGLNIRIREPNVLVVLDTSASMNAPLDDGAGGPADCEAGRPSRYYMAAAGLTGSIPNAYCYSSSPNGTDTFPMSKIDIPFGEREPGGGTDKVCVPSPSDHSSVWNAVDSSPGSWGSGGEDPIVFRRIDKAKEVANIRFKGGGHGHHGHGHHDDHGDTDGQCDFGQNDDGVIDTFKDRVRFGFASTDPLENVSGGALSNLPEFHNYRWISPWDGVSDEDDWMLQEQGIETTNRQNSYWWFDSSNQWTSMGAIWTRPGLYGSAILLDPTFKYNVLGVDTCPDVLDRRDINPLLPFQGCVDSYDMGIRNSHAAPWLGRLIGFGASSATTADIETHNEMVRLAAMTVGAYRKSSSPLSAMMRDAHEFMRKDTTSTGAELPFASSTTLGPKLDPLVTSGCRDQAVLVVSDGKQARDLAENPGAYSSALLLDQPGSTTPVKTYAVGVGPDEFTWSGTTYRCEDINQATAAVAFAAGGVCEYKADGYTFKNAGAETGAPIGTLAACCTMADLAIQGGTDPLWGSDASAVKKKLLKATGAIAGDRLSRAIPVYTRAYGGGTVDAPAVSYQLLSAMETDADGSLWHGLLHRLRSRCDSGAVVVDALDASLNPVGDKFEENLKNTTVRKRKLWTVVTPGLADHDALTRSIRLADYSSTDGLDAYTGVQTDLVEPQNLASEIATKWGGADAAEFLGLSGGGDASDCEDAFGTGVITGPGNGNKVKQCASEFFKWFGGLSSGSGADTHQRTSPLGAIWRSNPIIVPPPQPDISEESFSAEVRTGSQASNPSFVVRQKERPTMAYVQTIDGMLHAFVVQRNAKDTTGPIQDYFTKVPPADDGENNELWSFIPPGVAPGLWPNFDKNARLLDGPIVVRDVNFKRSKADRQDNVGDWRTVLVGSSGQGTGQSLYYAIDVTNPVSPKFLWQLSTQDDDKPLFGATVPGATITTLRVKNGANVDHVAVAILPGGEPSGSLPTGKVDRRSWTGTTGATPTYSGWSINGSWSGNNKPRKKIRDWGGGGLSSRSVTIVELSTGKIIGRMVGETADHTAGLAAAVKLDKDHFRFDSPMSGTPTPWPDFPSQPASRVYMGDRDGTLWRLDFTDPDPTKWEAQVAWDPYNDDSLSTTRCESCSPAAALSLTKTDDQKALMGQPIQADHMIISTDENGDPTVMFSTGDQETFQQVSSGTINFATSFVDPIRDRTLSPPYDPDLKTEIAFKDGNRVLGPMTLFDGKLYMSYFNPGTVGSCALGSSGWCAYDYADTAREGKGTPGDKRADAVADIDLDGTLETSDICGPLPGSQLIFGMVAFQQPSCELNPTDFGDAWFGGNYSAYTTSSGGSFTLFMHNSDPGGGGDDATISTATQTLDTPRSTTRVVSWTNVVE